MALSPHIVIVMPARREQECLAVLLPEFARAGLASLSLVLAVDDDADPSVAVAADAWSGKSFRVAMAERSGFGPAVCAGIDVALALCPDVVVTMCADGSDDPAALPRLVAPVLAGVSDMVIADRYLARSSYLRPASRIVNAVLAGVTAGEVRDWSTLYRAWRPGWLRNAELPAETATWGVETTRRTLLFGGRVATVPVRFRARIAGEPRIRASNWWTGFAGYMMRQSPDDWRQIWRRFHG